MTEPTTDIVAQLLAVDVRDEHDCYMNAPLFAKAAAEITTLRNFLKGIKASADLALANGEKGGSDG